MPIAGNIIPLVNYQTWTSIDRKTLQNLYELAIWKQRRSYCQFSFYLFKERVGFIEILHFVFC